MNLAGYLDTIEELRTRPFPARPERSGTVHSGPGFHIADLHVSEDFWDTDLSRVQEVEENFTAECGTLVAVLARRWGEPGALRLTEHLERSGAGEPVPPPLDELCGYVSEVYEWRLDGRWIGLGVGQQDREWPVQLVAAVGEAEAVGAAAAPGGEDGS